MQNRAVKKLPSGRVLVVNRNEFDETQIDWSVWPKSPRFSSDCPIAYSSFFVEVYKDHTWLPYDENFDASTRSLWKVLKTLCYKIGMRKSND